MNLGHIKQQITELAQQHSAIDEKSLDDFKEAEWIEEQVEDLIIAYCEQMGYLIDGFPTEKKKLPEEALDDDYFCRERYQLYLDMLLLEKEDVTELMWFYTSSFWPDAFKTKDDYLAFTRDDIASTGIDDV
jgi:hypothetical protein